MLDLGFEPQISAILGHMRHDRQSLLFSATWPAEVQTKVLSFLSDQGRPFLPLRWPAEVQTLAGRLIAPSHIVVEVISPAYLAISPPCLPHILPLPHISPYLPHISPYLPRRSAEHSPPPAAPLCPSSSCWQ